MAIDTRNLDQMLSELRAVSALAEGKPAAALQGAGGVAFADALKTAIDQVNAAQQQAQQLAQEFAGGNENVDLQDVMINLQKASLSFQQMVQVRNKLVTAYQDVMNMPV
ncbi:flagellar hook-basal body complex protein FliE [Sulfuricystis multivorans]|uniref:flagellar hook-basal body complex protein FliE n=1 Tax=Sulfuricystis multivorans TaxID=2211108 RepID=UPI0024DFAAA6|nr:flagellar hook-basal body complex protein FliE [Sulfuricystis multivorans]